MKFLIPTIVFALIFWSFKYDEQKFLKTNSLNSNLNNSDTIIKMEFPLNSLSTLNVQMGNQNSRISVFIYRDTYLHATLNTNKSNSQKIKIKQEADVLSLELDKKSSKIESDMTLILFTPMIKSVNLFSHGYVEINEFTEINELQTKISGCGMIRINSTSLFYSSIKNLNCTVYGSGEIVVDGKIKTENCHLTVFGEGELRLKSIKTKKAIINMNGNGVISITPLESLSGVIYGGGRVFYYGNLTNPKVEIHGCGELNLNDQQYTE